MNDFTDYSPEEVDSQIQAIVNDYELWIEELENEFLEVQDELEAANSFIRDYEALCADKISLLCPVCNGVVYQDVHDGLICRECRRTFELKQK